MRISAPSACIYGITVSYGFSCVSITIPIPNGTTDILAFSRNIVGWKFNVLLSANISITSSSFLMTNVIPGDFNYDGKLDLLVMGQADPVGKPNDRLFMRLYLGNGENA